LAWDHPSSPIQGLHQGRFSFQGKVKPQTVLVGVLLSIALVYGYMNLIIHHLGFYERFFTDIMKGSKEAKEIVYQFMSKYGDKHRHFGHGVLHGLINVVCLYLPVLYVMALLENKAKGFVIHHLMFWLFSGSLLGGLIAQFV